VFGECKALVQSAVDGYNVCIFAYGQTGSGKTHTIYGSQDAPGLAPRAVEELFRIASRDGSKLSFDVRLTMLELYQVGCGHQSAAVEGATRPLRTRDCCV
jgi:kinesin family protein C1